jgi:hypothetical protein
LQALINKLKDTIKKKPGQGLPAPLPSKTGRIIPCLKHSINISLFSPQYAIGYNFITASYVCSEDKTDILIIKMDFS